MVRRADGILGPHGEAVHAGAIEAGDVHGRQHVARQHTASGAGQDHDLLAKGLEVEMRVEAPLGLVSRDDVEKLLLTRRPPEGLTIMSSSHSRWPS